MFTTACRCLGLGLATFLSLTPFLADAQAPTKLWDRVIGGVGEEVAQVIRPTPDGGYVVGGLSGSPVSGDKTQGNRGFKDYWIVKCDANGTKQWDRTFGGDREDGLVDLKPTADGGYILAGSSFSDATGDKTQNSKSFYDYWVIKLDAQGNKMWDRDFGGDGQDLLASVHQTTDGGYILSGTSTSNVSVDKSQPSPFGAAYWVVKLDAQGTKLWDRTYGSDRECELGRLIPTADGGYLLGGSTVGGVSGDKTQPTKGGHDYWLIKLDAQGNKVWDRDLGGSDSERLADLVQTADGGYLIGGSSGSPVSGDKTLPNRGIRSFQDYWVIRLDAQGTKLWDQVVGGSENDELSTLLLTADGGCVLGGLSLSGVSGEKTQASQGDYDAWVVKLSATGQKQWDAGFGGTRLEMLRSLTQAPDGTLLLAATSGSPVSGDKTQPSRGMEDYWVLKLSALPTAAATARRAALGLYPNPARRAVHFTVPADAPRHGLQLRLLDATGRVVQQQALTAAGGQDLALAAGLVPGLYLLRLDGPGSYSTTQRLQVW
ncbi:T9SS type A sorting domain-containing protein [Hymenobacter jeollabukensis]|uniref:T9SS type A sorting domain-containing protein n=1 Tax=Hymenobacter jeollabukensis TaxID=2025313 RepID=A0A5R8WNP3_9BACT|nr:T9SS type A sorting domain-containing protein [Hymenobacter jeollabukensis]TLM91053.1 T9SS type A sorting domain-containing protein [Hymenobacter jeollabukensis]